MLHFAVLLILPCVFGDDIIDPVSAFDKHVRQETERLWVAFDFNHNSLYDLSDAHTFIKDYDTDGDGNVTKTEFEFHWDTQEPTLMIVGQGLFLEYDDNQDGVVTASDIDAMYNRMDQNNNGVVSKDEFKEYYRQLLTILFILQTQHIENSGSTP